MDRQDNAESISEEEFGTIAWANITERENKQLKERIKNLEDCLKNSLDVLNAVGPCVLQNDTTMMLTQGVAGAVNWAKRLLDTDK